MQRKVVFALVALSVVAIAGSAAAATLMAAPEQPIHGAFARNIADSIVAPDDQVPYEPPIVKHSGCRWKWN
jgi:hypothetical protein